MLQLFARAVIVLDGLGCAKILQIEHNIKNIQKFPKHILTNNFVGNLIIYSKGDMQIWKISHPFKCPVTFLWHFGEPKYCKN